MNEDEVRKLIDEEVERIVNEKLANIKAQIEDSEEKVKRSAQTWDFGDTCRNCRNSFSFNLARNYFLWNSMGLVQSINYSEVVSARITIFKQPKVLKRI